MKWKWNFTLLKLTNTPLIAVFRLFSTALNLLVINGKLTTEIWSYFVFLRKDMKNAKVSFTLKGMKSRRLFCLLTGKRLFRQRNNIKNVVICLKITHQLLLTAVCSNNMWNRLKTHSLKNRAKFRLRVILEHGKAVMERMISLSKNRPLIVSLIKSAPSV